MFSSEKYNCTCCGWEVTDVDSNGECRECRMVECDECGRKYTLDDLDGGLCYSCSDRLSREYEAEKKCRDADYWSSQF